MENYLCDHCKNEWTEEHAKKCPKCGEINFYELKECPFCKKHISKKAKSCKYCQQSLAVISCPSCQKKNSDTEKNCQFCGVELIKSEQKTESGPTENKAPSKYEKVIKSKFAGYPSLLVTCLMLFYFFSGIFCVMSATGEVSDHKPYRYGYNSNDSSLFLLLGVAHLVIAIGFFLRVTWGLFCAKALCAIQLSVIIVFSFMGAIVVVFSGDSIYTKLAILSLYPAVIAAMVAYFAMLNSGEVSSAFVKD